MGKRSQPRVGVRPDCRFLEEAGVLIEVRGFFPRQTARSKALGLYSRRRSRAARRRVLGGPNPPVSGTKKLAVAFQSPCQRAGAIKRRCDKDQADDSSAPISPARRGSRRCCASTELRKPAPRTGRGPARGSTGRRPAPRPCGSSEEAPQNVGVTVGGGEGMRRASLGAKMAVGGVSLATAPPTRVPRLADHRDRLYLYEQLGIREPGDFHHRGSGVGFAKVAPPDVVDPI